MDTVTRDRATLLAAKTVSLLGKPLNPPTLWAAQTIVTDRLHQQGLGDLTGRSSARPGPGRLRVARAVNWGAGPVNRRTFWAARVVVADRLARQG